MPSQSRPAPACIAEAPPAGTHPRHIPLHFNPILARPAVATERLSLLPVGRVMYELNHRWRDGTDPRPVPALGAPGRCPVPDRPGVGSGVSALEERIAGTASAAPVADLMGRLTDSR